MITLDVAPAPHPFAAADPTRRFDAAELLRAAPAEAAPDSAEADRAADAPASFARILSQRMKSDLSPQRRREQVYRNVEELVAQTLVVPVLERLGSDPLNSGLFERGDAEKALRPLLEAEVSKKIVAGMRTRLVDHMARRLLASAQATGAPPTAGAAEPQQRLNHA
ncbi:MAG: hypothetical protein KJZ69_16080 [Phycisphaerales bacterium]|nr:hypothetical protein [Phycisphaerales bacterium]